MSLVSSREKPHASSERVTHHDERTAKSNYGLNRAGGRTRELEEAWIIQTLVREDGMSQVEVVELLGTPQELGVPGGWRPPPRGRSCGCRRAASQPHRANTVQQNRPANDGS